mmetsp:Transcript_59682/g.129255  ORF Transcript_59682/g.129255 Transcript_59682/m.129255 type:complete len:272 (+) Transcript_59682:86-901(+)
MLSPRLSALCGENSPDVELKLVRGALLNDGLLSIEALSPLAMDTEAEAERLGLFGSARRAFTGIAAVARARVEGADEERKSQLFDVLNAEGEIIMAKTREDIHRNGFWHRAINVWVLSTSTSRVLLGQRSVGKEENQGRWTCACARLPRGELSMSFATQCLFSEFSIGVVPDKQLSLLFSIKCPRPILKGLFVGQHDKAWIDVYVACLEQETPVEKLSLDLREKRAAKYVTLDELQAAFESNSEDIVVPSAAEYSAKLLWHLRRLCKGQAP